MCVNDDGSIIYVFGGRIVEPRSRQSKRLLPLSIRRVAQLLQMALAEADGRSTADIPLPRSSRATADSAAAVCARVIVRERSRVNRGERRARDSHEPLKSRYWFVVSFFFYFRFPFDTLLIFFFCKWMMFSGLYSYEVATCKWSLLAADEASVSLPAANIREKPRWCAADESLPALIEERHVYGDVPLRARIGHSMTFFDNELHILAGQREHEYLADHVVYDVREKRVVRLQRDSSQVRC